MAPATAGAVFLLVSSFGGCAASGSSLGGATESAASDFPGRGAFPIAAHGGAE